MLSCVSDRKSDLKNFSTFSCNLIKNRFELNNLKHLPVIKEEGYLSEEESKLLQKTLGTVTINKNYGKKKANHINNKNKNLISSDKVKTANAFIKFPSSVNVNCLMNTDVKQTKAIWDTNFGKRLINDKKNSDESKIVSNIRAVKSDIVSKSKNRVLNNQKAKCFLKKKLIQQQNLKSKGEIKIKLNQSEESKEVNSDGQTTVNNTGSKEANVSKSPSAECRNSPFENLPKIISKESTGNSSTVSSVSKNQRILTEYVKNILFRDSNEALCEQCNQSFSTLEELSHHKKVHEIRKEICLLCNKVFENQNNFMQHLLTHESVDHFSCKKCKKYFPNLKKYKKHYQQFHLTPTASVTYKNQGYIEEIEKWLQKFECKRCKLEFDTKEEQEAHRINHNKKDLIGAYIISPKKIVSLNEC